MRDARNWSPHKNMLQHLRKSSFSRQSTADAENTPPLQLRFANVRFRVSAAQSCQSAIGHFQPFRFAPKSVIETQFPIA
jgi:hypothetical protein